MRSHMLCTCMQHGSRLLTKEKKMITKQWWMKKLWKTPHTVLHNPTAQRGQNYTQLQVY